MRHRITFIVLAVLLSSLVTFLFGRSAAPYLSISQGDGGWQMLLVAGTGWIVQIIAALVFMKRDPIIYLGHLSTVMVIGVLILVPGIILSSLTGYEYAGIPVVSVAASSLTMLWLHIKRVKHIGASQAWTLSWFLSLQVTAWAWAYVFYLQNVL
jgi:hypothetical protein